MLLPRFTMRLILAVMALIALAAFVIGFAVRGEAWAIGASLAMFCGVATFLFFFFFYLMAFGVGLVGSAVSSAAGPSANGLSPFASPKSADAPD